MSDEAGTLTHSLKIYHKKAGAFMTTFAERLKSLRAKRNLTQAKMAEQMGISASTLSRYETGKTIPSYDTISVYAQRLNVTAEWLSGQHVPRKRRSADAEDTPADSPAPVASAGSEAAEQISELPEEPPLSEELPPTPPEADALPEPEESPEI